jgi:hypothetical protein
VKIRKEQKEVLEAHALAILPARVRALLRTHLPEQREDLEGAPGLARVEAAVEKARARGFTGERDATKFVALGFVLGEGFAAEPWAAKILDDPGLATPGERIEALWGEAKARELSDAAAAMTKALR